jgi:hypothetical protein
LPLEPPSHLPSYAPATGQALAPKDFMLAVMHEPTVALALRIEAAKALLPHFEG